MANSNTKHYWRSPAEADQPEVLHENDLAAWREPTPDSVKRESFLKAVGFGVAGLTIAGCQKTPETTALPLLNQPAGITPGRPLHYATVCGACPAGCGVLAKCRDGRPIKLEGLPDHPLSAGGLCAVGQASLLGLYDSLRFESPQQDANQVSWAQVDNAIGTKLDAINDSGREICFLTSTLNSPTVQESLDQFLGKFKNARQVTFDALSSSAIADAHEQTHSVRAIPQFHFDKAEVIVSFGADFLGTWISPVQYTVQRTAGRQLDVDQPFMSYHAQFESCMTLTGSNADLRLAVAPSDIGLALSHLAVKVAELTNNELNSEPLDPSPIPGPIIDDLATRLTHAKGKSLVVSGEQDLKVQKLCNFINQVLGNYGSTLDISQPSNIRLGNDADLAKLIEDMKGGKIGALLIHETNPVLELPASLGFVEALNKVELTIQFAARPNDTTEYAQFVCPIPHFLESWADYETRPGLYSIGQPVIQPLFDTRPLLETLSAWTDGNATSRELIERRWESKVYPQVKLRESFRKFFHQAIHEGWVDVGGSGGAEASFNPGVVETVSSAPAETGFALVAYPKTGLLGGQHAYNAWLQELPDPVSKVTWDNYASLSVSAAKQLDVVEGDVVRLDFEGATDSSIELPVYVQPGTQDQVVAVALGYGGVATERFAGIGPQWIEARPTVGEDGRVGKNISPFLSLQENLFRNWRSGVKIVSVGRKHPLASTQTYHKLTVPENLAPPGAERRPIVQETSFETWKSYMEALEEKLAAQRAELAAIRASAAAQEENSAAETANTETQPANLEVQTVEAVTWKDEPPPWQIKHHEFGPDKLYPDDHPIDGHHWAMAVDLTACTGCSACVIACQAENNISVVGKDEVRRRRDMHWMRIDRYYSGEGDDVDVAHQPMMCQHCDNASCENVCPVLATVHTAEGLNAQVYNRCVGTRYCANNCAYKVRRFNWFYYERDDELENMVLNPDVTVRSRGVMEKCSFCVQRIQNAKIEAKRLGIPVSDESVQTACQQSCPAGAIVFGDINNPESSVSRTLKENPRAFRVLEEIDVDPSVHYLTQVRNSAEENGKGGEHHG